MPVFCREHLLKFRELPQCRKVPPALAPVEDDKPPPVNRVQFHWNPWAVEFVPQTDLLLSWLQWYCDYISWYGGGDFESEQGEKVDEMQGAQPTHATDDDSAAMVKELGPEGAANADDPTGSGEADKGLLKDDPEEEAFAKLGKETASRRIETEIKVAQRAVEGVRSEEQIEQLIKEAPCFYLKRYRFVKAFPPFPPDGEAQSSGSVEGNMEVRMTRVMTELFDQKLTPVLAHFQEHMQKVREHDSAIGQLGNRVVQVESGMAGLRTEWETWKRALLDN